VSILTLNIQEAGYGAKVVLNDISIDVTAGEIVAVIGPNGSGKSTLFKAVMNLLPNRKGNILFNNERIDTLSSENIVKKGISFVPQGNRIFTELTVKENFEIGGYLVNDKKIVRERIDYLLTLFPDLKERLNNDGGVLSGGEKQQLAVGRALMLQPRVLLLDEPSLGLSPKLVSQSFQIISKIQKELGTTIIIVEQKVIEIMKIANRVIALRMGEMVDSGSPEELLQGDRLKNVFLL
jgi:branched-chain amino acid transport system ATP-binding protein